MQNIRSERFPGYQLAGALGGRYEITKLIAAGGMAEVYEARDTVLDRRVAVKILHATYGADSEFVERFRREAMAAGKLNHASIVQVYDWGRSEDGAAYMVMELVEGQTLRDILTNNGPLDPPSAARIAEQVCAALEVARRAGIVHRDIKPENILVTPEGHVKVADFGVARALAESRATQAGVVLGTASYLAPEQVEGEAGDHRADLYALGTVLFEMLTGTTPFRGDNPVVVAYRRVAEDVPMVRSVRADVPAALEAITARATARRPGDRFATAGEMAAALAPLAGDATLSTVQQTQTIVLPDAQTQVIRRSVKPPRVAGRRGRRLTLLIAIVVTLAAVPFAIRAFAKVSVPKVVGLTQEAATATIEKAGLTAVPFPLHSATVPEGKVISVTPDVGAHVHRGTKIRLTISTGPASVTVPDVRNLTKADAVKKLLTVHLRSKATEAFSQSVAKGLVVTQNPLPPVSINENEFVELVISKGPEMIPIPDVAKRTLTDATQILQQAGFVVKSVRTTNEQVPRDEVVSSSPAATTPAPKGSTVTLTVSDGPAEFPMPDVRGDSYATAKATLLSYGLVPAQSQVPGSEGDTVISTTPKQGRKVHRGEHAICYTA